MRSKNLMRLAAMLLIALIAIPVCAQKKEKSKKEKKTYEWVMPSLSGNTDFDTYLLTCDTLYNRVKEYSESITYYHIGQITEVDKSGNPVLGEDGQPKKIFAVVDDNNTIRGSKQALAQYIQMAATGTTIISDLVHITVLTASASAALPSLGLKAVSYGKYVKAGPKIVQMSTDEINEILSNIKVQRKAIREFRKGVDEKGQLIDPSVDPSQAFGVEVIEITKPSEDVAKELAEAADADSKTGDFNDSDDDDPNADI